MNFLEEANSELEKFLKYKLSSYHELRNYDYGIEDHSNVSQISKYISHRILLEYDIIKKLKNCDPFIIHCFRKWIDLFKRIDKK